MGDKTPKVGIEKAREVAHGIKTPEKIENPTPAPAEIGPKTAKTDPIKKDPVQVEPTPPQTAIVKPEEVQPAQIENGQLMLTTKHKELIQKKIAPNATKEELELFFMMAYRTRLDPLLSQLYFIKYKNRKTGEEKVSYVTSIDGYRIIAHRTGMFDGIDEPTYTFDKNGALESCTVRLYRKDSEHAFAATVDFKEYNAGRNLWLTMPKTMLAKVAEAHALRKAFPQDLSGVYTQDEMDQAERSQAPAGALPKPPVAMFNKSQWAKVKELLEKKEKTTIQLKQFMQKAFNTQSLKEVTYEQGQKMIEVLTKLPDPEPKIEEPAPQEDIIKTAETIFNEPTPPAATQGSIDINVDEIDEGIKKMEEEENAKK
jgi:phage recombination protein Bet